MEKNELDIIQQSMGLFMRLGIKSVTMDELSRQLGISKKTLYKFVSDKNELVEKVLNYGCEIDQVGIQKICNLGLNAIDEAFEISKFVSDHIQNMHPSIMFDLQKYHAIAWNNFRTRKKSNISECYVSNMEKGIQEGLYREDLNIPVIVNYYVERFDIMFDEELFPRDEFDPSEIYRELFRYHIRGIATEKGIKVLVKKIKNETI